jgi:hypothetical protein
MLLSDSLDEEIFGQNITLSEYGFPVCIQAVYCNYGRPAIILNKNILITYARNAIKAHELGHHYTCPGDLCGASPPVRKKCEVLAGRWALLRIMPLEKLVSAYRAGVRALDELSDYLEISFETIASGLVTYQQIYGGKFRLGAYTITFDPFNIYPSSH